MDPTQWGSMAALAASPIGSLVLAFFVWKLTGEMKELKKSMYENGFLTREDLDDAWLRANELHKRQDQELIRLAVEVNRTRDRISTLERKQ